MQALREIGGKTSMAVFLSHPYDGVLLGTSFSAASQMVSATARRANWAGRRDSPREVF